MNTQVDKWVDEHFDEMLEDLCGCVKIDSVRGEEEEGLPFGRGPKAALDYTLQKAAANGWNTENLDNYCGYAEVGTGKEDLAIISHLDVVPAGSGWTEDPFEPYTENGKLFGRGVSDDKGQAFASMLALRAVQEAGFSFKRRVRLIFGCNEESGMKGIEYYREKEGAPTYSIVPDGMYPLTNMERSSISCTLKKEFESDIAFVSGDAANIVPDVATAAISEVDSETMTGIVKRMNLIDEFGVELEDTEAGVAITITGLSAHASRPQLGKNALQAMIKLLSRAPLLPADSEAMKALYDIFEMEYHGQKLLIDCSDESGRLTLNLGTIRWDKNGYELKLNLRVPNSAEESWLRERLEYAASKAGCTITSWKYSRGYHLDPSSELVHTLLGVYSKRTGIEDPKPVPARGNTYCRKLPNAVCFGPAGIDFQSTAHTADEYIPLETLRLNAKLLADAIIAFACEG